MRSQIFYLMRSCPVVWDTAFLEGMHSSVPAGILFCQNQTRTMSVCTSAITSMQTPSGLLCDIVFQVSLFPFVCTVPPTALLW